jgi:FKBP-type peptidyl-prolyl cis-trans isomerase FklB
MTTTNRLLVVLVLVLVLVVQYAMGYSYASTNQAGRRFLVKNAKLPHVHVTQSGLQYTVIHSSGGTKKPNRYDQVKVHYHGKLPDGTVFDSSVERKTPATFGVSQVIAGWTEALQLMSVGDKWELAIPADLAYGQRGAGAKIGPGAALVFEVELLDIIGSNTQDEL